LMNSQFILDQAARFARRLQQETGNDRIPEVTCAWQLAFSRSPTVSELADALEFLSRQEDHLQKVVPETDEKAKKGQKAEPATKPPPELQALTDLCQALLSANEFLYVD